MRSKFGGETPSCYGEFRLELPYGDYALAMLVWSQQTAKAEQLFAITNGNNKKRHRFGVFFVGSECWETRMKIIDNCFHRSFLHKVGSEASLNKTMTRDHTTGAAPIGGT